MERSGYPRRFGMRPRGSWSWALLAAAAVLLCSSSGALAQLKWSCKPRSANHASCCGKHIKLAQALGQCDESVAPGRRSLDKKVKFSMTVSPGPARSGQTVTVTAEFKNLTRRALDLHFVGHGGPMLDLKVTAEDDASVFPPPGPTPRHALLPMPGAPYPVRIRLEAGGKAVHEERWKVQAWEWGTKGGTPVRPPMRAGGKLKGGKYKISMRTMFDHDGHKLDKPEVWLTVKE